MKTILKTAAIAAILTGFANAAQAVEFTPLTKAQGAVTLLAGAQLSPASFGGDHVPAAILAQTSNKTSPPNIAIARLHEGRFLPLPQLEAPAWAALNTLSFAQFSALPASVHFDMIAAVPLGAPQSDNRIDEIRLAAAAASQDYVLIYAVNDGASWGRFGDRDLDATGLKYDIGSDAVRDGDAKALLVASYTGEVLGAVTTFAPDMETLVNLTAEMMAAVFTKA